MNSRKTMLSDAVTNTSYHEDENDIWQPMNNNNTSISYENANTIMQTNHHFEPIDHDFSAIPTSNEGNSSHSIQRPVPISNTGIERSKKPQQQQQQQQYVLQAKRNSTVHINSSDIDTTVRSYVLPRSVTSDQLANNNSTNRLYYYPSVQDVLDALNRRSFDKESYV